MTAEDKSDLVDAPSVEAWIEEHEPAGAQKLQTAVQQGSARPVIHPEISVVT